MIEEETPSVGAVLTMSDDDRAAAFRNRPPVSQIPIANLYHRWKTRTASGTWAMISRINWSQCQSCGEMLREWEDLPPPKCSTCEAYAARAAAMDRAEEAHRTARANRAKAQEAMAAVTSKTAPIRIGTVVKDYGDKWIEIEVDFATKNDGYIQHRQAFMNDTGDLRKACEVTAFTTLQREAGGKPLAPDQKARASAEWSAQLRLKVEAAKERDREASRYTPYWSPEEQSGGDL